MKNGIYKGRNLNKYIQTNNQYKCIKIYFYYFFVIEMFSYVIPGKRCGFRNQNTDPEYSDRYVLRIPPLGNFNYMTKDTAIE